MPSDAAGASGVVRCRPLGEAVSDATWATLTDLLHRAYAAQVALGLRPLAGRQTPQITKARCISGETLIAEIDDHASSELAAEPRLVGMILFQEQEEAAFPVWFLRPEVCHFSLFAVEPTLQGRGVGAALLDAIERRGAELGFTELALSMAEPDLALREYYFRRGFRFVQHWRWPYTNYRSAILSRPIGRHRH